MFSTVSVFGPLPNLARSTVDLFQFLALKELDLDPAIAQTPHAHSATRAQFQEEGLEHDLGRCKSRVRRRGSAGETPEGRTVELRPVVTVQKESNGEEYAFFTRPLTKRPLQLRVGSDGIASFHLRSSGMRSLWSSSCLFFHAAICHGPRSVFRVHALNFLSHKMRTLISATVFLPPLLSAAVHVLTVKKRTMIPRTPSCNLFIPLLLFLVVHALTF